MSGGGDELRRTDDTGVFGKGQSEDNSPAVAHPTHHHLSDECVWHLPVKPESGDLQPISTAVAMVATVLGASFRFSMCPDIWLSSSTAYLNMKGTITLVVCVCAGWEGRGGAEGEEEVETGGSTGGGRRLKQPIRQTYVPSIPVPFF